MVYVVEGDAEGDVVAGALMPSRLKRSMEPASLVL
jgi:hypothetical protein